MRAILIQRHGHPTNNCKYEDIKPKRTKEYGKPFSTFFDYGERRMIEWSRGENNNMSEIHKNRGNRRRRDRLKRKHKYNLAKVLCDAVKGVLGKYDKGHVYDLNKKKEEYDDYYQDGLSRADKRKIESCNEKLKDYESGKDEIDAMVVADIESYYEDNDG